jgi:phosphopantothenoylcysteine decarboxylase
MGERAPRGVLYLIVCAAPPAAHVQDLVKLAQADGWEVAVTATPEATPTRCASLPALGSG